ncbi:Rrf2 family transcriptional regulator [Sphingomonas oryzagri]|uniref:Rrf2 family transcriptional regulator n=1 Tax=Sphingomonas oryzagri TaxID=3042314 RepID=A0ABT6N5X2_9SPHN|nr:Rrf2 family transcriptional regulator [Sphingomonas oryzagri]MDH7640500.1 Rrf2 family transcriptional regulator [Sphingomonas oryzagri]
MRLTRYTDYAMRVLMHLGAREDELSSIAEIARAYGISQNHLMKVVQDLGKAGYVATQRGRGGGIRLARPAIDINLGAVVRHTEEGFDLVDCDDCLIAPACSLPRVLNEAVQAFLAVLDRYTLEDILVRRRDLRSLFGMATEPDAPLCADRAQ